jgi:hypothetical protein
MASTVSSPLMKRLEAAEERIKPKDTGDLQRRIDDFATRYQEGEEDERLDKYNDVFEKTEERPRQPAIEDDLDHQTVKKQCEEAEPLKRESSAFNRLSASTLQRIVFFAVLPQ